MWELIITCWASTCRCQIGWWQTLEKNLHLKSFIWHDKIWLCFGSIILSFTNETQLQHVLIYSLTPHDVPASACLVTMAPSTQTGSTAIKWKYRNVRWEWHSEAEALWWHLFAGKEKGSNSLPQIRRSVPSGISSCLMRVHCGSCEARHNNALLSGGFPVIYSTFTWHQSHSQGLRRAI